MFHTEHNRSRLKTTGWSQRARRPDDRGGGWRLCFEDLFASACPVQKRVCNRKDVGGAILSPSVNPSAMMILSGQEFRISDRVQCSHIQPFGPIWPPFGHPRLNGFVRESRDSRNWTTELLCLFGWRRLVGNFSTAPGSPYRDWLPG